MQSKKTIIVAQIFISGMMALLMSGTMSALFMGISAEWLSAWGKTFLLAWPIAFVYSLLVGPLAFRCANYVLGQRG